MIFVWKMCALLIKVILYRRRSCLTCSICESLYRIMKRWIFILLIFCQQLQLSILTIQDREGDFRIPQCPMRDLKTAEASALSTWQLNAWERPRGRPEKWKTKDHQDRKVFAMQTGFTIRTNSTAGIVLMMKLPSHRAVPAQTGQTAAYTA